MHQMRSEGDSKALPNGVGVVHIDGVAIHFKIPEERIRNFIEKRKPPLLGNVSSETTRPQYIPKETSPEQYIPMPAENDQPQRNPTIITQMPDPRNAVPIYQQTSDHTPGTSGNTHGQQGVQHPVYYVKRREEISTIYTGQMQVPNVQNLPRGTIHHHPGQYQPQPVMNTGSRYAAPSNTKFMKMGNVPFMPQQNNVQQQIHVSRPAYRNCKRSRSKETTCEGYEFLQQQPEQTLINVPSQTIYNTHTQFQTSYSYVAQTQHSTQPVINAQHSTQPVINAQHCTQSGINAQHSTQYGINAQHCTQSGINAQHSTQPVINAQHSTQPVINAQHSTQPVINAQHCTQTVINAQHSTQPGINAQHCTQPGINARPSVPYNPNNYTNRPPPPYYPPPMMAQQYTNQVYVLQQPSGQNLRFVAPPSQMAHPQGLSNQRPMQMSNPGFNSGLPTLQRTNQTQNKRFVRNQSVVVEHSVGTAVNQPQADIRYMPSDISGAHRQTINPNPQISNLDTRVQGGDFPQQGLTSSLHPSPQVSRPSTGSNGITVTLPTRLDVRFEKSSVGSHCNDQRPPVMHRNYSQSSELDTQNLQRIFSTLRPNPSVAVNENFTSATCQNFQQPTVNVNHDTPPQEASEKIHPSTAFPPSVQRPLSAPNEPWITVTPPDRSFQTSPMLSRPQSHEGLQTVIPTPGPIPPSYDFTKAQVMATDNISKPQSLQSTTEVTTCFEDEIPSPDKICNAEPTNKEPNNNLESTLLRSESSSRKAQPFVQRETREKFIDLNSSRPSVSQLLLEQGSGNYAPHRSRQEQTCGTEKIRAQSFETPPLVTPEDCANNDEMESPILTSLLHKSDSTPLRSCKRNMYPNPEGRGEVVTENSRVSGPQTFTGSITAAQASALTAATEQASSREGCSNFPVNSRSETGQSLAETNETIQYHRKRLDEIVIRLNSLVSLTKVNTKPSEASQRTSENGLRQSELPAVETEKKTATPAENETSHDGQIGKISPVCGEAILDDEICSDNDQLYIDSDYEPDGPSPQSDSEIHIIKAKNVGPDLQAGPKSSTKKTSAKFGDSEAKEKPEFQCLQYVNLRGTIERLEVRCYPCIQENNNHGKTAGKVMSNNLSEKKSTDAQPPQSVACASSPKNPVDEKSKKMESTEDKIHQKMAPHIASVATQLDSLMEMPLEEPNSKKMKSAVNKQYQKMTSHIANSVTQLDSPTEKPLEEPNSKQMGPTEDKLYHKMSSHIESRATQLDSSTEKPLKGPQTSDSPQISDSVASNVESTKDTPSQAPSNSITESTNSIKDSSMDKVHQDPQASNSDSVAANAPSPVDVNTMQAASTFTPESVTSTKQPTAHKLFQKSLVTTTRMGIPETLVEERDKQSTSSELQNDIKLKKCSVVLQKLDISSMSVKVPMTGAYKGQIWRDATNHETSSIHKKEKGPNNVKQWSFGEEHKARREKIQNKVRDVVNQQTKLERGRSPTIKPSKGLTEKCVDEVTITGRVLEKLPPENTGGASVEHGDNKKTNSYAKKVTAKVRNVGEKDTHTAQKASSTSVSTRKRNKEFQLATEEPDSTSKIVITKVRSVNKKDKHTVPKTSSTSDNCRVSTLQSMCGFAVYNLNLLLKSSKAQTRSNNKRKGGVSNDATPQKNKKSCETEANIVQDRGSYDSSKKCSDSRETVGTTSRNHREAQDELPRQPNAPDRESTAEPSHADQDDGPCSSSQEQNVLNFQSCEKSNAEQDQRDLNETAGHFSLLQPQQRERNLFSWYNKFCERDQTVEQGVRETTKVKSSKILSKSNNIHSQASNSFKPPYDENELPPKKRRRNKSGENVSPKSKNISNGVFFTASD